MIAHTVIYFLIFVFVCKTTTGLVVNVGNPKNCINSKDKCPACDSSVYSYCNKYIYHDAYCCGAPIEYYRMPYYPINCEKFYANSCYEHFLIKECCCSRP